MLCFASLASVTACCWPIVFFIKHFYVFWRYRSSLAYGFARRLTVYYLYTIIIIKLLFTVQETLQLCDIGTVCLLVDRQWCLSCPVCEYCHASEQPFNKNNISMICLACAWVTSNCALYLLLHMACNEAHCHKLLVFHMLWCLKQ